MSCYTRVKCEDYRNLLKNYKIYKEDAAEDEEFSTPMIWIGIYIAAASLLCFLATAADVFRGFMERKLWFPCKFITLNAVSLTLLGVAMKLPLDLNSSMPGQADQLVKLSSSVFLCTIMGNYLPSLGALHDEGILSNVVALAILVITLVVNIGIELDTGVIYHDLYIEYILVSFFLMILLVVLCFSAVAVPTTKKYLEWKYSELHRVAFYKPEENKGRLIRVEKLIEDIRKYWMMVQTGNPQFVLARSVTCAAAGVVCLFAAFILAQAEIRLFFKGGVNWYVSSSSYKYSTLATLGIQSIGVIVGTIGPAFRWFIGTNYKYSQKASINNLRREFMIESYWIQGLKDWREKPMDVRIHSRKFRKFLQVSKNMTVTICIAIQIFILLASKTVRVVSILSLTPVLSCCYYCKKLKRKLISEHTNCNNQKSHKIGSAEEMELGRYVLLLEGEEELPTRILNRISDAVNRLIHIARRNRPRRLKKLIDKSTSFQGVAEFDSDQIECLHCEEPPNVWSLPVVTLTSIAIALPNVRKSTVKKLIKRVREGLLYIGLVEKSLDVNGDLLNIISAADFLWIGVDLYRSWLDIDLLKMSEEGSTCSENIGSLSEMAERIVMKFKGKLSEAGPREIPLNWPAKVIAANSMYRISKTILLDPQCSTYKAEVKLFDKICTMIADITGACLTNLPRVITLKCSHSAIENREDNVKLAASLLGETEEILKRVQRHELPDLNNDQFAYIDEWRFSFRSKNTWRPLSPSSNEYISVGSSEVHIDIE
ncbi:Transmembrane protein [Heracleum sosnowskyi]|uniref:Transmembrane protein n=1 Tax=Heracleum sosnowskyi TaxID=360622 RepID=A0AAD8I666_9APIA|nr:Transmembrane protein [Heracleum sosnowskyi]